MNFNTNTKLKEFLSRKDIDNIYQLFLIAFEILNDSLIIKPVSFHYETLAILIDSSKISFFNPLLKSIPFEVEKENIEEFEDFLSSFLDEYWSVR